LLRRKKAKQENGKHGRIYYVTRGRKGHLSSKMIDEVAPPDKKIESWIKKNKKRFKDRYGDGYEKYLYGKAWNNYNGKLTESVEDDDEWITINKDSDDETLSSAHEILTEIIDVMDASGIIEIGTDKIRDHISDMYGKCKNIIEKMWELDLFQNANPVDSSFNIKNDDLYSHFENLENSVRDYAYEDGYYNRYYEREYDSESTWDNILNEPTDRLLQNYLSSRDWSGFYEDITDLTETVEGIIANTTPISIRWDGSEEQEGLSQEEQQQQIAQVRTELKNRFKKLFELRDYVTEISDNPSISEVETLLHDIDLFDSECSCNDLNNAVDEETLRQLNNAIRKVSDLRDTIEQNARDSAQESGDFDVYSDEEFDQDATWENIDDNTICDWVNHIGSISDRISIYLKVIEIKKILERCNDVYNSEYTPVSSTGEEFNESASYNF